MTSIFRVLAVPFGAGRVVPKHVAGERHPVEPIQGTGRRGHHRRDTACQLGDRLQRAQREQLGGGRNDLVGGAGVFGLEVVRGGGPRNAARLDGVEHDARVVGHRRDAEIVLEPRQNHAVRRDEQQVFLALQVAQVLDRGVERVEVLQRSDAGAGEFLQRHVEPFGGAQDRLVEGRLQVTMAGCHLGVDQGLGVLAGIAGQPGGVGNGHGWQLPDWRGVGAAKGLVDFALSRGRNLPTSVQRLQAAELLGDQSLNPILVAPGSLQRTGDLLVIRREVGRAVPRQHGHLVLRKQLLPDKPQERVHPLRRLLQSSSSEDDEEDPVLRRNWLSPLRLAKRRGRPWRRRLGRQGILRQMADLLARAVLEDREVLGLQPRDGRSVRAEHADIHRHERRSAAEGGRRRTLLRLGRLRSREPRHQQGESESQEWNPALHMPRSSRAACPPWETHAATRDGASKTRTG